MNVLYTHHSYYEYKAAAGKSSEREEGKASYICYLALV